MIAGDQVLMWAAVASVAALLATYPTAAFAVQWLGAGYLAWLGFKMLTGQAGCQTPEHRAAPLFQTRQG